jgi:membrane protein YdbS with pleckstrin-like domain
VGRLVRFLTDPEIGARLLRDGSPDDETLADVVRQHWVSFIRPVLVALAGVACWASVPFTSVKAGWFPILLGLALLAWATSMALRRNIDRFVITSERVFRVHGVLNRREAEMPLGRILDTTVYKPLLGRMLNYGHFTFESAAQDQGLKEIRYVRDIDRRRLTIQQVTRNAGLRGRHRAQGQPYR